MAWIRCVGPAGFGSSRSMCVYYRSANGSAQACLCQGIQMNMLEHMRISLDLPDPLLRKAQKLARQRKVTFRTLMADALRRYLAAAEAPRQPFKLPGRSFKGDGLVTGLAETDWE